MAKSPSAEERVQLMKQLRDQKVRSHLSQYAPLWLVEETAIPEEDRLLFNVVFLHPHYGWVRRRYSYDVVTDVLYHKGQTTLDETEALELQQTEPYLKSATFNTVLSYGG